MKLILTQGMEAIVDDDDPKEPWRFKWSAHKCRNTWYAIRNVQGRTITLHRFLMGEPDGQVDHEDGDGLNNQRINLRLATHTENQCNRGPNINNTSGFKGVTWDQRERLWKAQIKVNRTNIHLGYFVNPKDAADAYDNAAIRLHGEFARTNRKVA